MLCIGTIMASRVEQRRWWSLPQPPMTLSHVRLVPACCCCRCFCAFRFAPSAFRLRSRGQQSCLGSLRQPFVPKLPVMYLPSRLTPALLHQPTKAANILQSRSRRNPKHAAQLVATARQAGQTSDFEDAENDPQNGTRGQRRWADLPRRRICEQAEQ